MDLLPETVAQSDGSGPVVKIDPNGSRLMVATLGIDSVIEQVDLGVSIWGSEDHANWGGTLIAAFPHRSYCGLYSTLLNLASRPKIRYIRIQWTMNRWSKAKTGPLPGFFVFRVGAEPSGARVSAASR